MIFQVLSSHNFQNFKNKDLFFIALNKVANLKTFRSTSKMEEGLDGLYPDLQVLENHVCALGTRRSQ